MYKAQFADPSKETVKAMAQAQQRICAGPWYAIPTIALQRLRAVGFPTEFPDVSVLARAAQLRLVASLPSFFTLFGQAKAALDSEECILDGLRPTWVQTTAIFRMERNWVTAHGLRNIRVTIRENRDKRNFQKQLYRLLHGNGIAEELVAALATRTTNMLKRDCRPLVEAICHRIAARTLCMPPCVRASLLRTISNGWVTSARLHLPWSTCRFGCSHSAPDALQHYVACPRLTQPLAAYLDVLPDSPGPDYLYRLLDPRGKDNTHVLVDYLHNDIAYTAFNAVRNDARTTPATAIGARLKTLTRRSPEVRRVLDPIRAFEAASA